MLVSKLKEVWKEITLLSTWIASVAGAFIIPLPSWHASDENTSFFMKFGVFIATALAGFLILYSHKNKLIRTWMRLSVQFIVLLIGFYATYHFARETRTLPYIDKDIVIGNEMLDDNPFEAFKASHGFLPARNEQMMILLGDPEKAWTKKSIMSNRIQLMALLFFCYLFSAGFIISFCNLVILYKDKYRIKIEAK
ncbi:MULTISPECIES: hypothetical protein [Aquimarina]|uniref:Uncharacterized protein n=1 Tax=Aquimarina algiphila TaxID=2047982 RepID=A0A554VBU7_9FLAO|nr:MULTISPECIES: hypothetical protein [Aquimarina]TSE04095.1 hypothetical protein FOF46_27510 [Aquimarina algiphila]